VQTKVQAYIQNMQQLVFIHFKYLVFIGLKAEIAEINRKIEIIVDDAELLLRAARAACRPKCQQKKKCSAGNPGIKVIIQQPRPVVVSADVEALVQDQLAKPIVY
jgi:hypothetical protein